MFNIQKKQRYRLASNTTLSQNDSIHFLRIILHVCQGTQNVGAPGGEYVLATLEMLKLLEFWNATSLSVCPNSSPKSVEMRKKHNSWTWSRMLTLLQWMSRSWVHKERGKNNCGIFIHRQQQHRSYFFSITLLPLNSSGFAMYTKGRYLTSSSS